jgi:hypothetical protein
MKAITTLVCSVGVMAAFTGIVHADDASPDYAAYKQKMHDCVTQMKTDHPDMNYKARRKACHKQLGPAPKKDAAAPAPAPTSP